MLEKFSFAFRTKIAVLEDFLCSYATNPDLFTVGNARNESTHTYFLFRR